jgi:hypothetical protein
VSVNVCACSLQVTAGPNTAWGYSCYCGNGGVGSRRFIWCFSCERSLLAMDVSALSAIVDYWKPMRGNDNEGPPEVRKKCEEEKAWARCS